MSKKLVEWTTAEKGRGKYGSDCVFPQNAFRIVDRHPVDRCKNQSDHDVAKLT